MRHLAFALLLALAGCTLDRSSEDTVTGPGTAPPAILSLVATPMGDCHSVQFGWQVSGLAAPFETRLAPGDGAEVTLLGASGLYVHWYEDGALTYQALATATELATGRQASDTASVRPCP